ncbi:MAG: ATP-binding cassette domain-containing protein, partial [Ignavibacteria bacterium]|nr:ATP-binding cassette domain-containing protein [Ignavibacteria bacterium]
MKSVLKALNLSKEYKKHRVVDNVSVEVKQGEIVGLLGPNGAGKTTTFYMICGMVKPLEGEIEMDGDNIS